MRFFIAPISMMFALAGTTMAAPAPPPTSDWATCAAARELSLKSMPTADQVIAACDRVLKSRGRKPHELSVVHVNRCWAFQSKRDLDTALADCNEAVSLDAKSADAYSARCRVWTSKSDFDRALSDCNEALRLNPELGNAYRYRCLLWNSKKEFERAIPDCTQAIRISPKNVLNYLDRGFIYRLQGDYDRAVADYSEAIRLNPKYVNAYNNRCVVWNFKNDPDRALKDCSEAIRLEPKYAFAYNNRANAWRAKGDVERAIADYGDAVRLDPKYVTAFSSRGLLYEKLGNFDKALADFRAVLALNPQLPNAAERVQRLERRLAAANEPKPPTTAPTPAPTTTPRPAATPAPTPAPTPQAPNASTPTPRPTATPAPAPAAPSTRVALVIGNGSYSNVSSLPNARTDADRIAAALRAVGFSTVTVTHDLPREKITEALKSFSTLADRADWAVVYYAGHGIEFGGANYLIPTDAKLSSDRDITFEAVSLDQVMIAVEGAQKLRLVILDACRDNPFARTMRRTMPTRSVGRGLARVEPEGATLVVFAAKDGQVANDGDAGGNSPFATAFAKYIETPGLEINFLFRKVRDDVLTATSRRQEPFVYGSLPASEFYFRSK